jgi:chemotaxis protein methyltransferase CheR
MFAFLEQEILPDLAQQAISQGVDHLRIWSVGAGAGEEPYTLAIIWKLLFQKKYSNLRLQILATDSDTNMLQRAKTACYEYGSVKNLPAQWRDEVFSRHDAQYCLKLTYKGDVKFLNHDVRDEFPGDVTGERVDIVLCRNLVFTYFDEALQNVIYSRILSVLKEGGILVLGIHEQLPKNAIGVKVLSGRLRVYKKQVENME